MVEACNQRGERELCSQDIILQTSKKVRPIHNQSSNSVGIEHVCVYFYMLQILLYELELVM